MSEKNYDMTAEDAGLVLDGLDKAHAEITGVIGLLRESDSPYIPELEKVLYRISAIYDDFIDDIEAGNIRTDIETLG